MVAPFPPQPQTIMTATALASFKDFSPEEDDFLGDVVAGLSANPKSLPCKYFYDAEGSRLFDMICALPEYYPTRTEIGILKENARDIADHVGSECILIELGSGASEKVRSLFDALKPASYLGVDISRDFLLRSTRQLASDYDWLDVHAVCADFSHQLELPSSCNHRPIVAFYPGSSIGNFEPVEAKRFLREIAKTIGEDGKFIIGVDLKKDKQILDAAYNDEAGVTADFNLNLLNRMREELDAELDESAFVHQAFYNEAAGRIEMHLVSKTSQTIRIGDEAFRFSPGEGIHTENSYKYDLDEFSSLAKESGLSVDRVWTDDEKFFSVLLMTTV